MTAADRLDPQRPRHVYRWDLDKTYLRTEFHSLRELLRTAFQPARDKVNVPGTAALMRELRHRGITPNRLCILSGSPRQMRAVLEEKLAIDGNEPDELVLKPNLSNMLRGRFRALREQLGYKLPALLESRTRAPRDAGETLFGDDAESDAFIYSLYADILAGAVDEKTLVAVLEAFEVYEDQADAVVALARRVERRDAVGHIFIHLDRLSPPARFRPFGPRLVPIYNYFQAALVLMAEGQINAASVARVAAEMVVDYGYNLLSLGNSFQDLVRRGLPVAPLAEAIAEVLAGDARVLQVLRPGPDILKAFVSRIAALGSIPPPPMAAPVDYLALAEQSRSGPRTPGRAAG